jgi:hypothetical protein
MKGKGRQNEGCCPAGLLCSLSFRFAMCAVLDRGCQSVELNVVPQGLAYRERRSCRVQWKRSLWPMLHGLIYDLHDGLLSSWYCRWTAKTRSGHCWSGCCV